MMGSKKKICVVTNYGRTANYGAILQAYALNRRIRSLGCDCRTLNYRAPRIDRVRAIRTHIGRPGVLAALAWGSVARRMASRTCRMRAAAFDRFREACIPHTRPCGAGDAGGVGREFDALICGSDQIWRPNQPMGEFDDVMWLKPFPRSIPRYSYAASLGTSQLDDDQAAYIRDALRSFRAVSVREESARIRLEQICGREVQTVLDPVFLLTPEEWRAFARPVRGGRYVFCYFIQPAWKIYRRVEQFARAAGLEIVFMPYMGYRFNWPDRLLRARRVEAATPREFVGLIDGAACVCTDSFHATAFSAMLRRDVHVFITNHGSRLRDLMKLTGLEDRIEGGAPVSDARIPPERWDDVESRLAAARERSEQFLRRALT